MSELNQLVEVRTESGSQYEIRIYTDAEYATVTRVSDSDIYDLNNHGIMHDPMKYFTHEVLLAMEANPNPGDRWRFQTKFGWTATTPVISVAWSIDKNAPDYDEEPLFYDEESILNAEGPSFTFPIGDFEDEYEDPFDEEDDWFLD